MRKGRSRLDDLHSLAPYSEPNFGRLDCAYAPEAQIRYTQLIWRQPQYLAPGVGQEESEHGRTVEGYCAGSGSLGCDDFESPARPSGHRGGDASPRSETSE